MTMGILPWNILLDPAEAFSQLAQKPRWLLSLSLLILTNLALWIYYYEAVDFGWLQDFLMNNNANIKTAAEREEAMRFLQKSNLVRMASLGVLIGIPLMCFLSAMYYSLMGKLVDIDKNFSTWFGFVVLAAFPGILCVPVMLAALLMSDARITPEQMNVLSMNELLLQGKAETPFKALLDSISLITLWSIGLAGFGLRQWSGRSWIQCVSIALFPYLLPYGILMAVSLG